jgi:hypothetical protein
MDAGSVASRAHNLLDGTEGGGAIGVGIVTTGGYILATLLPTDPHPQHTYTPLTALSLD